MAGSIDEPEIQPVRELEELPSDDKGRIKNLQGYLRTYFRNRQPKYQEFRETLNEANMPVTYYDYLAKAHVYAAVAGVAGVVFGIVLSGILIAAGGLASPIVCLCPVFSASSRLSNPPSRTSTRSSSQFSSVVSQPVGCGTLCSADPHQWLLRAGGR